MPMLSTLTVFVYVTIYVIMGDIYINIYVSLLTVAASGHSWLHLWRNEVVCMSIALTVILVKWVFSKLWINVPQNVNRCCRVAAVLSEMSCSYHTELFNDHIAQRQNEVVLSNSIIPHYSQGLRLMRVCGRNLAFGLYWCWFFWVFHTSRPVFF